MPSLKLKPWILAARPKTLLAGIVPVWLGSVLPIHFGLDTSLCLAFLILASCLCIQIATNLFNDVIDHDKGADTAERKGPQRATQSGLLSRKAVWLGAIGFLGLAALFALPLIQLRGWPVLAIGIPSLFFAYGYTGGPFPLAYRGLGELFVIIFFGVVAMTGAYFIQTGTWSHQPVVLGLQVGQLSTVLIAINNLRDVAEDKKAGKRTLAVRFGKDFARCEIAFFCIFPVMMGGHWMHHQMPAFTLPFLTYAVSALIIWKVFTTEPGPVYNKWLALAALQLLVFGCLFTIGILSK
ncbi:MAG: 1,4-dihydroxy-2-naphthoate octaprenyltransferase [Verrucomicrobiales bacterium]|jgi:1,4-dihydroxy-2-naphthoate octaprenyltransferase